MTDSDSRCWPLVEVEPAQLQTLLAPVLAGAALIDVKRVEGGLINTLYRITPAGGGVSLCLRIFAAGQRPWQTERNVLARVAAALPVPQVLLADCGGGSFPHPYLVYRWIEGMTLDECRRRMPPAAFLSLAEPLGRLLARMASLPFADAYKGQASAAPVAALLAVNEGRLRRGPARAHLGAALADALWQRLEAGAGRLGARDCAACLVHGDLGGRNILVAPAGDGAWRVSGLIDWEAAFSGAALWDVGRVFRYARRYSETFRERFERAYREAGGDLPEDWWRTARLLDATRLVEILNEERELSVVFAECRELIEAVVADWA